LFVDCFFLWLAIRMGDFLLTSQGAQT
jgi:hypothetical protein